MKKHHPKCLYPLPGDNLCSCSGLELRDLRRALGRVAELGERCEECEPTEAPYATHVVIRRDFSVHGLEEYLCPQHAEEARQAHRKAESKGCGPQPEVQEHEQETAVLIALEALGIKVGEPLDKASVPTGSEEK